MAFILSLKVGSYSGFSTSGENLKGTSMMLQRKKYTGAKIIRTKSPIRALLREGKKRQLRRTAK